jgi:hypothetical protein
LRWNGIQEDEVLVSRRALLFFAIDLNGQTEKRKKVEVQTPEPRTTARNGEKRGNARRAKRQSATYRVGASELKRAQVRTDPASLEDVEAIDQLIDCFFPIALAAEEDFNRALKAAYTVTELVDIRTELLLSVAKDLREFCF